MAVSEFALIERYFTPKLNNQTVNILGGGDDCALMKVPVGQTLAISTDTMVEGVHFFAGANPAFLGHKLLAVNLSDLAAMGAKPVAVTLALTLPDVNAEWLSHFSEGFLNLAKQFSVDLVGGDTTSGNLTLTVQVMGLVPDQQAMLRSTAKVGDLIYVTGCLGESGLGLKIETGYRCNNAEQALKQFHQPLPQVAAGLMIRPYASACIDLSDGIASDLKHILDKSGVGAILDWHKLPLSKEVKHYISETGEWAFPLTAGEDYELCFTVSPENSKFIDIECTLIGEIERQAGLRIQRLGMTENLEEKGYEHFN